MIEAIMVRPNFDPASEYSFKWAQRLMDAVKDRVSFVDLAADNATRERVESALESSPRADFVFEDHGSEEGLAAQGGEEYCIDKANDQLLEGRVVYTMACLWASDGGVDAWRKGARVVVGYVKEFTFSPDYEELFCRAANSGYVAYADGEADWGKIKQVMIEEFNRAIDECDDPWAKMWLLWDRDCLRIYPVDAPESKCLFRRLALRLFGTPGWRLSKAFPISVALYAFGLGVLIHDYCDALYEVGGVREVLSFQGGYIGAIIMTAGFLLSYYEINNLLREN
jgi:hypothetical protein